MSPWLMALALVGFGSGIYPASANSLANDSLADLTPMSMVEALSPAPLSVNYLDDVASQIQYQAIPTDDPQSPDFRQMPLFGSMMDENGNLNLPLGLLLYNTMGDTSIGFDAKF